MAIVTVEQRLARLEAAVFKNKTDTDQVAANLDFVSMMAGIEFPEDENDEQELYEG